LSSGLRWCCQRRWPRYQWQCYCRQTRWHSLISSGKIAAAIAAGIRGISSRDVKALVPDGAAGRVCAKSYRNVVAVGPMRVGQIAGGEIAADGAAGIRLRSRSDVVTLITGGVCAQSERGVVAADTMSVCVSSGR
jgi:hypothetical protein